MDKTRVFCNLCKEEKKKERGISYCGGTTSLNNHMDSHHPDHWFEYKKEALMANSENEGDKQPGIKKFMHPKAFQWPKNGARWKATTKQIAMWFVKDSRPAEMVEDEGFRRLMALIKPEYSVPCANTITNYIAKLYINDKARIEKELEKTEFVACTTDGGSSSNCSSFQEVGVHALSEDFNLMYFNIGVNEVKDEHDAPNYKKNCDNNTQEFGVKDKIVIYTTDNENKMLSAFEKDERNGCAAHILHSSVSKGLKEVPENKDAIDKHRKIITKHNKSFKVKYALQEFQNKRGITQRPLIQDVPTRWGSTRVSTGSFLDHKDDIKDNVVVAGDDRRSRFFGEDTLAGFENAKAINDAIRAAYTKNPREKLNDYILTETDMKRIKHLNAFLTKFDVYSTTLGGNTFVTSSIVMPMVKSLQGHLKHDDDDPKYITEMKTIILEDFRGRVGKYLNNGFLFNATALDPRFKKLKMVSDKKARDRVFEGLLNEARAHLESIKNNHQEALLEEQFLPEKKRKLGLDYPESESDEEDGNDALETEWKNYWNAPGVPQDGDILAWWRTNRKAYPNLARLAR